MIRDAVYIHPTLAEAVQSAVLSFFAQDTPPKTKRLWVEYPAQKKMKIVPGATRLFEEPGALEQVARLAAEWFKEHLQAQPRASAASG